MCGRFVIIIKRHDLEKHYGLRESGEAKLAGSYNVAPTEIVPAIIESADGEREIREMAFGYRITVGPKKIMLPNIPAEKAPARKDFEKRRYIISANGFYEWEKTDDGKQPHYYKRFFSFAGLWTEGKEDASFAILTTEANDLIQPVHHRMPVILSHNAVEAWLSAGSGKEELASL